MRVVFRADASVSLGTGHVRRCLELASRLSAAGAQIAFVCVEAPGDMIAEIASGGLAVTALRAGAWEADAQQTGSAIAAGGSAPRWLVVDHYGLDARWERTLRATGRHLMAIDDLADRPHDCDLLLDQNLRNPRHARYARLLPQTARSLLGPEYALLGAPFAQLRPAALARRSGQLQRVLISMGGTDPNNDTARALAGLRSSRYAGVAVDVVAGAANPHRSELEARCAEQPGCRLHVQTARMAQLMAAADLAITGGGSTTWERCALGLPALAVVQSPDQSAIAQAVARAGGHRLLGSSAEVAAAHYTAALEALSPAALREMSTAAAALCDGRGAERVAALLGNWSGVAA